MRLNGDPENPDINLILLFIRIMCPSINLLSKVCIAHSIKSFVHSFIPSFLPIIIIYLGVTRYLTLPYLYFRIFTHAVNVKT